MPKVSQAYLDVRRGKILEAATRCFARDGFHRATMKDIVRESKLSPGAIYNYFRSKEQIVEAIANERHRKERQSIGEARNGKTVEKVLGQIRDAFFGGLRDPKERLRRKVSIQLWAEAQRNPAVLKLIRQGVDGPRKLLGDILAGAQKKGEISDQVNADAAARMLIAVFHGLVLQQEWEGEIEIAPQLELLDSFLKALKGPAATAERRV
jgi:TetR/AcrR family transcriptional regulator, transcriptional repressor of aconitase